MKPIHTFTSETKDTVFYACGECGWATTDLESAERCCTCDMCGGPRTERYRYICDGCSPERNWLMSDGFDIEDYEVGAEVREAISVLNDVIRDDLPTFWTATGVRVDVTEPYKALDTSNDL